MDNLDVYHEQRNYPQVNCSSTAILDNNCDNAVTYETVDNDKTCNVYGLLEGPFLLTMSDSGNSNEGDISVGDSTDGSLFNQTCFSVSNEDNDGEGNNIANTLKKSRKRRSQPNGWMDNAAKKARNSGEAGVSRTGNSFAARKFRTGCNRTCRFECHTKINVDDRKNIFHSFWALGHRTRQWDYVARYMRTFQPRERTSEAENVTYRKNQSHEFFLATSTKKIKVCRTMFVDTLGISRHWLLTVDRKKRKSTDGQFISADERGSHANRPKRIPDAVTQSVRDHINTFERVESHYTRESRSREYLDENLNIQKMYRKYVEWMSTREDVNVASAHHYRDTFNTYNLSFRKPKKDQCAKCTHFRFLTIEEKIEEQADYDLHQNNKRRSRELMRQDKEFAIQDNQILCTACFDLPKVLITPQSKTSVMCYSRKLAVYNLTVFDMANHKGTCYIWNETIAKRGANEISSCIWQFISSKVQSGTKEFRFYSGNCGGQNRNQILFSMYVKAAMYFQIKITHRYLETGHTQNDGDSMYARIELECKNRSIYTQNEWCQLIEEAKVTEPHYAVHELQQREVFDFSKLAEKKKWAKLKISQLREITMNGNGEIQYKYGYDEELLTVSMGTATWQNRDLERAYIGKLQLDENKKKDLQSLLDKGLIPPHCQGFYADILT